MRRNELPPIEHPNAHLKSLTAPSYADLQKGILRRPCITSTSLPWIKCREPVLTLTEWFKAMEPPPRSESQRP